MRPILRLAEIALVLLLVLTMVSWVRSHFREDVLSESFRLTTPALTMNASVARVRVSSGEIWLTFYSALAGQRQNSRYGWTGGAVPPSEATTLAGRAGFRWNSGPAGMPGFSYTLVSVPHWLIAMALAGATVAVVLFDRRRARRLTEGLCRVCGYDLRATPDRCPECGTAAASSSSPAVGAAG